MGGAMVKLLVISAIVLVAVAAITVSALHASKGGQNAAGSPGGADVSRVVSATDAATRTLCLASILARTNLEYGLKFDPSSTSNNRPDDDAFQQKQRRWMEGQGLWNGLSLRERTLLEKPVGTWSEPEIADGQWRAEAIGVLLWALKPNDKLPPYDRQISSADVMAALPSPDDSVRFIRKAQLRSAEEIIAARGIAELWLWRARTTQLQMTGAAAPEGWTFEKIIAMAAEKANEDKLFVPIDHDFPALNKAYSKLSEDEWHTMRSIAQERLYALNWLCKYAEDWDEVPTGT
jgi:hypothetical protein